MSNILRVLLSRALFSETMKQRERLEVEIRVKREAEASENMSLEERIEAINERRKCRERFCVRPIMAETYEINMMQLYIVIKILTIIMTIVCVFGLIMYRDGVLDGNDCTGILVPIFLWLLTYLVSFGQKYMAETKYIFYQNRISIRRLWKKEKVVIYTELSEYIKEKGQNT